MLYIKSVSVHPMYMFFIGTYSNYNFAHIHEIYAHPVVSAEEVLRDQYKP